MSSSCDPFRQELDLTLGEAYSEQLAEHLAGCADCARIERALLALRNLGSVSAPEELDAEVAKGLSEESRIQRALGALGRLDRVEAPATLDGRIVAATQAGFRQDRAVDQVGSLPPVPAPPALDELVVGDEEVAPLELDGRVSAELARPELYVGPRLARDLAPLDAPKELEARLLEQLRTPRRRVLRVAYTTGLAAAALLLFWIGFGDVVPEPNPMPTIDLDNLSFEVRRVDSAADLSPFARSLVDGLSGGALLPESLEEF